MNATRTSRRADPDRPRCVLCDAELDPHGPGRNQTFIPIPGAKPTDRAVRIFLCLECRRDLNHNAATLKSLLAKLDALLG